jgi:hypothetical protein
MKKSKKELLDAMTFSNQAIQNVLEKPKDKKRISELRDASAVLTASIARHSKRSKKAKLVATAEA